jgi:hypothetical protein
MKKYLNLTIAALVAVLLLGSCKKSKGPDPTDTTASSMKLSANGTAISYNYCLATTVTVNDLVETDILGNNLTNGKPGDDSFQLTIMHDIATIKAGQTYQAGAVFAKADDAYLTYSSNQTGTFDSQVNSPQGSITITAVTSTTISGTFSGKLYNAGDFDATQLMYTITNGTFTAKKNQ